MAQQAQGSVVLEEVIPAKGYKALTMEKGQVLRVVDVEGQQVLDFVAFNAQDPEEKLSMFWSNCFNRTWKLTEGHTLYTNRSNPMFFILKDTVRMNSSAGAFCTEQSDFFRYGIHDLANCADNLTQALAPHGIQRKDIDEACCLNIFMNVAFDPDGTFEIREPISKPGDHIDLRAEMNVLVGLSNCPQERNPCNAFRPTPLSITLYES
ncbi:MAG: DUF1989 domain-containing protein [Nitrospinota bacterium]